METLESRLYAMQNITKPNDITDAVIDNIRLTALEAQREINRLESELKICRNELCLRCGNYREAHKGACDGCRFKDIA